MVYVVTGGPGFGKTSTINRLSELGFPVCPEGARNILAEYLQQRQPEQPSIPPGFEKMIAEQRLTFLISNSPDSIAFADRGLPDQVAFSIYKQKVPSDFLLNLVELNRYAPVVFVTPPWAEIYKQDEIRTETFGEAVRIHEQIVAVYSALSYKIINLPLANIEERVKFIRNFLDI